MHKNKPTEPPHYTLHVRKGILEVDPASSSSGQFVITTDSLTWKELVLAKLDAAVAVADGRVAISGGTPESFYAFMDLLNDGMMRCLLEHLIISFGPDGGLLRLRGSWML